MPEAVLTEETCTSSVQHYHLIAKLEKRNQLTSNALRRILSQLSKPRTDRRTNFFGRIHDHFFTGRRLRQLQVHCLVCLDSGISKVLWRVRRLSETYGRCNSEG